MQDVTMLSKEAQYGPSSSFKLAEAYRNYASFYPSGNLATPENRRVKIRTGRAKKRPKALASSRVIVLWSLGRAPEW